LSSDREAERLEFLKAAGLETAERHPLPGDASTRRYERLKTAGGATLMLMDQAPAAESVICDPTMTPDQRRAAGWNATARLSAGRIEAFAGVAAYLKSGQGLSAPDIVALDAPRGLAVLEDFGDDLFARVIEQGQAEAPLYLGAVEALAHLHEVAPPTSLVVGALSWPVLDYDATALQGGADLFVEWLPQLDPRLSFGEAALDEWAAAWAPLVARGAAGASVLAHRDYHAENLIWLPGRTGAARVGMIDFQDAVRAHPSWDLHSLLQDARRDVSPDLEAQALAHYFALRPQTDREAFLADYAALAALNEARILGIFARLIARDGKPRYRAFMPRMWRHLEQNLKRPELAQLSAWFDRHVPQESRT
jgi:aminoglycoside/choline kinase family phosphotransferase